MARYLILMSGGVQGQHTLLSFNGKAFAVVLEMRWRVTGEPQIHEADCAAHPVQVQACWRAQPLN